MCGHNADGEKKARFVCDECWQLAWRRAQVTSVQKLDGAYEAAENDSQFVTKQKAYDAESTCPRCHGLVTVKPESFEGVCKEEWYCFLGLSCTWQRPYRGGGSDTVLQGGHCSSSGNAAWRRWQCPYCRVDVCRRCMADYLRGATDAGVSCVEFHGYLMEVPVAITETIREVSECCYKKRRLAI